LTEAEKTKVTEIADYHALNGDHDFASVLKSLLEEKTWGSGFVHKANDGRMMLITNLHVVGPASTVDVSFDQGSKEKQSIHCPVIYKDDYIDVAIIQLPDSLSIPFNSIDFADSIPDEGSDVWSAGYPGFENKPTWQLGKGIVSNRSVFLDGIGPHMASDFIQHSASIDRGNSGGPLLIRSTSEPPVYKVIGVNTRTAHNRQNTFFAVPLENLKAVLDKAAKSGADASDENFHTVILELMHDLHAKTAQKYLGQHYISDRMAMDEGWSIFKNHVVTMTVKDRSNAVEDFHSRSFNALKDAVFDYLFFAIPPNWQVFLEKTEKSGNGWITYLRVESDTVLIQWGFEAGTWKINELEMKKLSDVYDRQNLQASTQEPDSPLVKALEARYIPKILPSGLFVSAGLSRTPNGGMWQNSANLSIVNATKTYRNLSCACTVATFSRPKPSFIFFLSSRLFQEDSLMDLRIRRLGPFLC